VHEGEERPWHDGAEGEWLLRKMLLLVGLEIARRVLKKVLRV
jgi:hypothetical protein